ncbi:DUF1788 domain-containing protein [Salibacterium aidingense]|uniref:DUF1788 domain-containing protein n=1 Tax=Salibacterium aidingense TaxID=384933 RepID=UPI0004152FA4|nr:DUF1788 domain-containing protein [Salibacterium aidingense]
MANILERLDQIIPKIRSDKFIEGYGLGNEISFYIFDYDPQYELLVRDHIDHVKNQFSHTNSGRKIIEFDLYKMLIESLEEKNIFERVFQIEKQQGEEALLRAMQNFAKPQMFLDKIQREISDHNVVFITGVGKIYPFIRSHTVLNSLQEVIDKTPVIMFFPGKYDGMSLKLFGKFKDNYYRAFRLVDDQLLEGEY